MSASSLDPAGLAEAVRLVRARGVVAQLCLLRAGEIVLDEAIGCQPDALFWIFSASKPFVAILVHRLAQRGALALDDPVARYWPEFGQRGKQEITIRQVLQHRSGLPVARSVLADGLAMTNWRRSVRHLERARPSWPAGQGPAYHIISYGFILGELVRRVTGVPVREHLATELCQPLGLRDTYLGLTDEVWHRRVPLRVRGSAAWPRAAYFNRRATRYAVIPAAGVSTTARDLARFYQVLLDGGVRDGVQVIDPAAIEAARRPSSDGEWDQLLGSPVRWAQGFQLGGPVEDGRWPRAMGGLSSPLTFGHNGSKCCIGWADPSRGLAFAYLTDLLPRGREGSRHQAAVADAILAACS